MVRSNGFKYFILFFYRDNMFMCFGVVYEYASILVILINIIVLINIKFIIKYY
jgi:type IV secretory pathway VirB3-like protein